MPSPIILKVLMPILARSLLPRVGRNLVQSRSKSVVLQRISEGLTVPRTLLKHRISPV